MPHRSIASHFEQSLKPITEAYIYLHPTNIASINNPVINMFILLYLVIHIAVVLVVTMCPIWQMWKLYRIKTCEESLQLTDHYC